MSLPAFFARLGIASLLMVTTSGLVHAQTRLFIANQGGNIGILKANTGTPIGSVSVSGSLLGIATHRVQPIVFVTSSSANLVHAVSGNAVLWSAATGTRPHGVAVSRLGTELIVANLGDNSVTLIDVSSRTATATILVGMAPTGVAASPTTQRVYVANAGSASISVIDIDTRTVVATWSTSNFPLDNPVDSPVGLAVSPDGAKLYVANSGSASVSVHDTVTGSETARVSVGGFPSGIAVSPDGTRVVVANGFDGSASIIDATSNALIGTINGVGALPAGVAIASDSTEAYVVSAGSNSFARIDLSNLALAPGLGPTGAQPANLGTFYIADTSSSCTLDIDGNGGAPDAATDGMLVLRYLLGFRGTGLTSGAVGFGATLSDAQIETRLASMTFDFDGNHTDRAATDGLMLVRLMLGIRGSALGNAAGGTPEATLLANVRAQHGDGCFPP